MSDERNLIVKCPACGEMFTVPFSPYMPNKSAPCPACGSNIPIKENIAPAPTPETPGTPTSTAPVAQPPSMQHVTTYSAPKKTSGMAIAGMILGITSITPGIIFGGLLLSLLGLIFSAAALREINRAPMKLDGKGLAIAGLTTSVVGLLWSLIALMLFLVMGATITSFFHALAQGMQPPGIGR